MLSIGKGFVLTKILISKERSDEDFRDNEGLEAAVNIGLFGRNRLRKAIVPEL